MGKDGRFIYSRWRMKAIIAAVDEKFGIGKNGKIPWHVPDDFKWFKEQTQNSICVMGYNTFKELADKFDYHNTGKLLPKRLSCVITSKNIPINHNVMAFKSISEANEFFKDDSRDIFYIGGAGIFEEALYFVDMIFLTSIHGEYDCDIFFPRETFEQQKIKMKYAVGGKGCSFYVGGRN